MSTVSREGVRSGGRRRSCNGASSTAVVLLFWAIVLIFSHELSLCVVADRHLHEHKTHGQGAVVKSQVPRKARLFKPAQLSSYAPAASPPPQLPVDIDPADMIYGDDKRIIHTGPNPLHN
ncbi:hypothetical protein HS088_TW02G00856 [Tripterygium wilfordii]|uniref:Uncharacterized protein n=1 Tax=Tripterygium wilfordii TaxID=458696 RepID=A0A7J7DZU4_TRIWF|nr:hypothetical protein HS088_TW02G00856 [Tripterygium wilfordii]